MAIGFPSPELSSLSMSLLDLDSNESNKPMEYSPSSDVIAYSQDPVSRNGSGTSQHSAWTSPLTQESEYQQNGFYATTAIQTGQHFCPQPQNAQFPFHSSIAQTNKFTQQLYIPERQLDQCYAYAFDRGDGTYTRLIPADNLPQMYGVVQAQSREGLIVLPKPRGLPPYPRQAAPSVTDIRYGVRPAPVGEVYANLPRISNAVRTQNAIDHIVSSNSNNKSSSKSQVKGNGASQKGKREKIYCDKWLHDGTCAFTQQGCRYLHEMPMDKETQMSVGLFNGLPAWYKRMKTVELREPPRRRGPGVGTGSGRGRALPISSLSFS